MGSNVTTCPGCLRADCDVQHVLEHGFWVAESYCRHCKSRWRTASGVTERRSGQERRSVVRHERRERPTNVDAPDAWMSHLAALDPWEMAVIRRLTLMLVGAPSTTGSFIARLRPWLVNPIAEVECSDDLTLEHLETYRTVIFYDIDRLPTRAQEQLVKWLDRVARHTQVISTANRPLMPLVTSGDFTDALYYRLNTVYIELGPPSA